MRDPSGGANVAVLCPRAFTKPRPHRTETWHIFPRRDGVRAWRDLPTNEGFELSIAELSHDPRLAPR